MSITKYQVAATASLLTLAALVVFLIAKTDTTPTALDTSATVKNGVVDVKKVSFLAECGKVGKDDTFCNCVYDKGLRGGYEGYPPTIVNGSQKSIYNNTGIAPTSTPVDQCQ